MKVVNGCLCLVVLFIVLAPGFALNVPSRPEDTQIIPGLVGFAGFGNTVQTVVHAVIFGVLAMFVCKACRKN